jgi:hypothetical protein
VNCNPLAWGISSFLEEQSVFKLVLSRLPIIAIKPENETPGPVLCRHDERLTGNPFCCTLIWFHNATGENK